MRIILGDLIARISDETVEFCIITSPPFYDTRLFTEWIEINNEYYSTQTVERIDLPLGSGRMKVLHNFADEWGYSAVMYLEGTSTLYKIGPSDEVRQNKFLKSLERGGGLV